MGVKISQAVMRSLATIEPTQQEKGEARTGSKLLLTDKKTMVT